MHGKPRFKQGQVFLKVINSFHSIKLTLSTAASIKNDNKQLKTQKQEGI